MQGEFSVVQWFEDGQYEYVRTFVDEQEAAKAFHHYCRSVGAKLGMTKRVIITDGGDCIAAEWKFGEGVVFPSATKGGV